MNWRNDKMKMAEEIVNEVREYAWKDKIVNSYVDRTFKGGGVKA